MKLYEEYEKETNISAYECYDGVSYGPTDEYVAWLEHKISKYNLLCPDDCVHKIGRHCILQSPNNCIRQAADYYECKQAVLDQEN